jgi:HPt (histidine-containing phosphotransfer) domain-containing protein
VTAHRATNAEWTMDAVLNHETLNGLKSLIGDAKCDAALQRFQDELRACMAAIESGAAERAESAHRLAGVAGLLGFEDVEKHSRTFLEAVHQAPGNVAACTEQLVEAARRAEAELAATIRH